MRPATPLRPRRNRNGRIVEHLVRGLAEAMERAQEAEIVAEGPGFLQRLDPRVKMAVLAALAAAAILTTTLSGVGLLLALALALAATAGRAAFRPIRRMWAVVLLFGGIIALPAPFLVPGEAVARLPLVDATVTRQGLRSAVFLIGRAETMTTFVLAAVLTTPWPRVLKALGFLGLPAVATAILGIAHRYVFLLFGLALNLSTAYRSRCVAPPDGAGRRQFAAAAAGTLFVRSFRLAGEVHGAMLSRGYDGRPRLLGDFRARPLDWAVLAAGLAVPVLILGMRL